MRDIIYRDTAGDWRRSFTLRLFGANPLRQWYWRSLWHSFTERWASSMFALDLSSGPGNGECYCSGAIETRLHVLFMGAGFSLWIGRNRNPRTCLCQLSLMEAMPDDYAEEIEEVGGIDRVRELIEQRIKWFRKYGDGAWRKQVVA